MILVTKRQVSAFLFLWEATAYGTKPWTGVVRVDGMAQENVGDCLGNLRRKSAIDWQMTIPRTYRVSVKLEDLNVQERKVCQASNGETVIKGGKIRDSGAFLAEALRVGLPPFKDANLPASLPLYTRAAPRPDARAL